MAKLIQLTPEQQAQMPVYRDKWIGIGLSTEPADRPRAERGIVEAYKIAGLGAPKIVWCSSPLAMALTRAIVIDQIQDKSAGKKVGASVWASVGASVRASVGASVGASVRASVGDSVRASVWDSVWASVGASVWASVRASARASVRASVWDSVWASVRASVRASARASVGDSVRASVWASVRASVGDSVWDSVGASGYGQHDANWIAFYAFFREVCGLTTQTEKLGGLTEITQSAGWFLPHENICWVSERHCVVKQDSRLRIHCEDGPAIKYPDGWAIYAIHGVRVPPNIIEEPLSITTKMIDDERNVEVRRVMIERYKGGRAKDGGAARYMLDAGAKLVDEIPLGDGHPSARGAKLWRRECPDDEPIVMVEMVNGTPEPDGEIKHYFERVHPELCPMSLGKNGEAIYGKPQSPTALNAIASRLGMTGTQYQKLLVQT